MTGTKKGLEKVEDKIDKLIDVTTNLATQIAVIVTENRNSSKNSAKLEKNQIDQGKLVRHIEKDYGERLTTLETQRDGKWRATTFICAAIAALASVIVVIKPLL